MNKIKIVGILIFGIITPATILFVSYGNLSKSTALIEGDTSITAIADNFKNTVDKLNTFNEYTLYSLMLVEANNLKSIVNKQHMKNTVMHIGFATISLGLSLILLGIKEEKGGGTASIKASGIIFDVKTGSTGAYVFVVGAVMSTIGGSLPNKYQGSKLPVYQKETSVVKHEIHDTSKAAPIEDQKSFIKGIRGQKSYDKCVLENGDDQNTLGLCLANEFKKHFGDG